MTPLAKLWEKQLYIPLAWPLHLNVLFLKSTLMLLVNSIPAQRGLCVLSDLLASRNHSKNTFPESVAYRFSQQLVLSIGSALVEECEIDF